MSDGPPQREWRFYIEDMVSFCDKVFSSTQGIDRASFSTNQMRCAAVLRNIELMGEAATHIPADVRAAARGAPWRMKA